jgi:hypothetical protein
MRRELRERIEGVVIIEGREQARLGATHDFAEGVRAVAERRPGRFIGS